MLYNQYPSLNYGGSLLTLLRRRDLLTDSVTPSLSYLFWGDDSIILMFHAITNGRVIQWYTVDKSTVGTHGPSVLSLLRRCLWVPTHRLSVTRALTGRTQGIDCDTYVLSRSTSPPFIRVHLDVFETVSWFQTRLRLSILSRTVKDRILVCCNSCRHQGSVHWVGWGSSKRFHAEWTRPLSPDVTTPTSKETLI